MMDNPLRSVTARITGGIQRFRHGNEHTVVSHVDDDPDAEPLPPLATTDTADEELTRLDDEDAQPVEIAEGIALVDLFGELDPVPPLPLTAPHEIGLSVVVLRLAGLSNDPLLEDRRVRRVMDLLGDRLTVAVGPDGITVRGLLRTRHTPWKNMQELTFTSRYDLLKGHLVTQLADDIAGRLFPLPIPGLAWLLRRIVGTVGNLYERRTFTAEEQEELRTGLGYALANIQRRGVDIELAGALRVLMFFSSGLSAAIEAEAADRGIKVAGGST